MRYFLVTVLCISLFLTGCASTQTIPLALHSGETVPHVQSGETVRVFMKSGEVRRMKVQSADAQTLTGKSLDPATSGSIIQIALSDAQSMQVRSFSGRRTSALVAGVVVGIAVVAVGGLLVAQCGIKLNDCGD